MNRKELIQKYIEFFKEKGHLEIPGASLIPENDPTVLFTTAGMHPLIPFLTGQKHPLGRRLVDVQRCIRTGDIEDVGDTTHHTFFEMLGNWSLGDYFKNEAIGYSYEFLTKVLNIPKERLAVSVFAGDKDAPKDEESAKKWKSLGIPEKRIAFLPKKNNWWGPAGETGPCGPDTEMFYWKLNSEKAPQSFDPENENWVEIWNDVLMQYNKDKGGKYEEAKQKNIDTGMGVERTTAVLNGLEDNYLADMWKPIIGEIEKISGEKYKGNEKTMRIIADHLKAAVFMISDGVEPSNTERGYVLRRLIRRAVKYGRKLNLKDFTSEITKPVFEIYSDYKLDKEKISDKLLEEEKRFNETIEKGMGIFSRLTKDKEELSGKEGFLLYQSYGFPLEMIIEETKDRKIKFDPKGFKAEYEKHQELSRSLSAGKFKSGLIDNSNKTTRLHTATHLLNEALRHVLKDKGITQRGSNITSERLRFDFNFPRKLTKEEIKKVEKWVNDKVERDLPVKREEMNLEEAINSGAQHEFGAKYPIRISVYTVYDEKNPEKPVSREICTGPHVGRTSEVGKFRIVKEESSSAGIRRIKAVVD
jgi:alanyl-tRNA synthetase